MVTLEELKAHLRIEQDDEDGLLATLLRMAESAALDFCKGVEFDPAPEPVRLAILLMAGHFFTHRENGDGEAYDAMISAFHALLWPYREPELMF